MPPVRRLPDEWVRQRSERAQREGPTPALPLRLVHSGRRRRRAALLLRGHEQIDAQVLAQVGAVLDAAADPDLEEAIREAMDELQTPVSPVAERANQLDAEIARLRTRRTGIRRAKRVLEKIAGAERVQNVHFLMDFEGATDAGEVEDQGPPPPDTAE